MSRMVVVAAGIVLAVGPALRPAIGQELVFQAEAQTLTGSCNGQPVRLEGNHNSVTLTGVCGSLLLKGVANTVQLGIVPGGSIHVEGSGNRVQFAAGGALPAIVALGPDNDVAPAPAAVAERASSAPSVKPVKPATPVASAEPLVLAGDDKHQIADCTGRAVTITGERSAYIVRGGCKSLTVRGDLLAVQAELGAGAKLTVTGRGSVVSWAMKGKGPGPVSSVRGEGSRVQRSEP